MQTPSIFIRPIARDRALTYYNTGASNAISYKLNLSGPTNSTIYYTTIPTFTVSGLSNGCNYDTSVQAVYAGGILSEPVQYRSVQPGFIPGIIQNCTTIIQGNTATFNWDAPSNNGGAEIKWYVVSDNATGIRYSAKPYLRRRQITYNSTISSTFTIRAVNDPGYGPVFNTFTNIVSDGLLRYYEFNSSNRIVQNLVTLSNDAFINGTYTFNNRRIAFINTNTDQASNISGFQLSNAVSNVRTISMWVNISSFQPGLLLGTQQRIYYLLDARDGASNSWIWQGESPSQNGDLWINSNSFMYVNTSNAGSITLVGTAKYPKDTWTNLTFISASNITDDISFFMRSNAVGGMNCQVGNILLYNRVLSAQEVSRNYNAFVGRFGA